MSRTPSIDWQWRDRADPPAPRAAVAWGRQATLLHTRLAALPPDALPTLDATAGGELLVVAGDAAALPWIDGIAYAAPCDEAPALWLPTRSEPDLPLDLLARRLQRLHGRQPLLLWPQPAAVVPLDRLMPLSPELLARIGAQWRALR